MATMLVFEGDREVILALRQAADTIPNLQCRIIDEWVIFQNELAADYAEPPDVVLISGGGIKQTAVPEILAYLQGLWGSLPAGRIWLALDAGEEWLVSASNALFGEGHIQVIPRSDPRWRVPSILIQYLLNQAGVS
ncbi:MAG: hypothetical protein HYV42_02550 [Candidatus Magasanikbacteria bacterium]|nr:hypothetical protein [Candidatus Magasanikbacteria bacterium]